MMGRKRTGSGLDEQQWRAHIEAQHKSSQSVRAYCEEHTLTLASFYYYKRRFACAPRFVEIVPAQLPGESGVEVITGEVRVRVHRGFCEQTFVRVIELLQGVRQEC